MTSQQDTGTSPLLPLADEPTSPSASRGAGRNNSSPVHSGSQSGGVQNTSPINSEDHSPPGETQERESISRGYTPSSTPVRPFRFSEHIHRDRHIFLKGASVGIGCGSSAAPLAASADPHAVPCGLTHSLTWIADSLRSRQRVLDRQRSLIYPSQCLQSGMALGDDNLPSVNRVQLALSSGDCSKQRHNAHHRFPQVHQHHQPPALRRRPFNEQLNTYVDTQKRIRFVQCLDDLYRSTPSPAHPYLSIPSPKRPKALPAPVKGRVPAARASIPTLNHQPTLLQHQPLNVPSRPVGKGAGQTSPRTQPAEAGASNTGNMSTTGAQDADQALAEARHALHDVQQASSNHNYAQYFLAKEGREGTLGHLFDSYPKRMLVHPGRALRQRNDIASRARFKMFR